MKTRFRRAIPCPHSSAPVLLASLLAPLLAACTPSSDPKPPPGESGAAEAPRLEKPIVVEGGFQTPESVLHDAVADVYLVSNIHGLPSGGDDKAGFISRVNPDGTIESLAWIDGAKEGVTLRAPKGMVIVGDVLWVSDVASVRRFHRTTGAPQGSIDIEGAGFLNDLTADATGTVYVSDTGYQVDPRTDAVHAIAPDGSVKTLARGTELAMPNGLLATDDGLAMIAWESRELSLLKADGTRTPLATLPATQNDGLVRDRRGAWHVSSWEAGALVFVSPDGKQVTKGSETLDAPADIGYDARRDRLLVPLFNENRVLIMDAPGS